MNSPSNVTHIKNQALSVWMILAQKHINFIFYILWTFYMVCECSVTYICDSKDLTQS
jgi:hypothetical protein